MNATRPRRVSSVVVASAIALLGAFLVFPRAAHAAPPSAELLARLAVHAAQFEAMRTRASYALDGRLERIDGDGKANGAQEMNARVVADGAHARFVIVKFMEDGEDKTEEARAKARDREAEKKKDIRMPFHVGEQHRYVFEQLEADRLDPSRVRISFVPRDPEEDTIEGSAWVDTRAGTVLSTGFKLSKPSFFVDYVRVTVEFGAPTPLGPAISKVTVEGKGGVLFFRKHFRGAATLSDYRVVP